MVTTTDRVQNLDLNVIKKKLARGWSVQLAKELNVSRKTISAIFREKRFNSRVWDEINRMVQEYDEREKAAMAALQPGGNSTNTIQQQQTA